MTWWKITRDKMVGLKSRLRNAKKLMRGLRRWGRGRKLTQQEVKRGRRSSFIRLANYINDILFKFLSSMSICC